MGTSQSSPGPKGGSPLVPPWADDQPSTPLPEPVPARFRPFRQSLGYFVKSGDGRKLRTAIGHYARSGSGGSGTAIRRMNPVIKAGATLYSVLSGDGAFGVPGEKEIRLSDLAGQHCEIAIAAIIQALTPGDGDADKIRVAMNHALVEALDGVETFDQSCITDEVIVNTMICFLAESIFLQVVMDAGKSWNKAISATQAVMAENDLRELIKVVVDKYMAQKFVGKTRLFTNTEIVQLERQVISEVWNEWENYQ